MGMLYCSHKAIKFSKSVDFIRVAELRRFQRAPQDLNGFVVRFEGNREGMSVLAPEREGIASRVGKSYWRTMNHLCHQRQRLQSARTKLLQQQQRREVPELALIGDCQHSTKPLKIYVARPDIMMRGHCQLADITYSNFRFLSYGIQQ